MLTERVDGEVRFDVGTRGAYAHDGSNYRQPPAGVVLPRTAGQCCSEAVVELGIALDKVNDAVYRRLRELRDSFLGDLRTGFPDIPRRVFDADAALLRRCGVAVEVLDSGCCGLAGNFGFGRGHYDVSAACAERGLWPAARVGRHRHLAQLLDHLQNNLPNNAKHGDGKW